MTEHECTQKELIEEKFKGVYLHQQAGFDLINQKLIQILEQTTKTNGRVNTLEQTRYKMIGYAMAISTVFTIIVTYFTLKK